VRAHGAANVERVLVHTRTHGGSMTLSGGEANVRETDATIAANLRAAFGDEVGSDDLAAIAKLRLGLPGVEIDAFLARFDRLLGVYRTLHHEVAGSADFRRTVARQVATVLRLSRLRSGAAVRGALRFQLGGYPVLGEVLRSFTSWARARESRRAGP
jgi:hypothetical protein